MSKVRSLRAIRAVVHAWWVAPVDYRERVRYFQRRGLLGGAQVLIGSCSLLIGLVAVAVFASAGSAAATVRPIASLLIAAAFVFQRARGIDPWRSGLGPVILLNLALPFIFTNLNISIGGHIGGLIGGAIAALAIEWLGSRRRGDLLPVLACVAVGAVSVAGAIVVSSG